jgi:signal transduction histidine kinase/CheY-like chemotaxis protein
VEVLVRDAKDERALAITVDVDGRILWADAAARQLLDLTLGHLVTGIAARGAEDSIRALIDGAGHGETRAADVPIKLGPLVRTFHVVAFSAGDGRVSLVATGTLDAPIEPGRSLSQQLAHARKELADSAKGVMSLHAELADKAETLHRTSEVRTRVIANVSHEFRTPLHTILALSKLLLDEIDGPVNGEQAKQLRFIRSSAEELMHLVNDLLDLSKAEAGKLLLRPRRFTIQDLFQILRGTMRPVVEQIAGVELCFDEPASTIELDTDDGKLSQIMRNLISNAGKFTPGGEIHVGATVDGELVRLYVKDDGIGIAPEHHEQIFEEFSQVDHALQGKVKGSGLGLALSRRFAELLGGTLTVDSELGRGATFTVEIPRVHPEVGAMDVIEQRPLDPERAPVLVVEDDRKTIFIYEKYLALAGFQVVPARNIGDARRLLETTTPAAIVLDIMLEGETSWDFLAQIKRDPRTRDIPVLVVTVTNKEQKARALGADEFWLKPIDQDRLLRKLKSLAPVTPARVLAIDDDEAARYLLRRYLERTPYTLYEACGSEDGLAIAREQRPNVILLDFFLEDETAFDILDELKGDPRTRGIPVIVITSHVLGADERQRLAADTTAILSKETLSRELAINRIRDALRKAGLGGSAAGAAAP